MIVRWTPRGLVQPPRDPERLRHHRSRCPVGSGIVYARLGESHGYRRQSGVLTAGLLSAACGTTVRRTGAEAKLLVWGFDLYRAEHHLHVHAGMSLLTCRPQQTPA